jgi:hypothetical protein
MEYRGVEYTVIVDARGNWQWAVSLGNPKTIKSGQDATKGTAILKVWAAIDRRLAVYYAEGPKRNGADAIVQAFSGSR